MGSGASVFEDNPMRSLLPLVPMAALSACKQDETPALAFDPIWVEPVGEDIHGFETWQIYTDRWAKHDKEKFYVCAVVVELEGTPTAPGDGCRGCALAWDVTPTVIDSDCADRLTDDPGFLALTRLAIGDVGNGLDADNPYPAKAQGGWADYGTGEWEAHGWAYPESLDTRGQAASADWDGDQPFQFWPAFYWDLTAGG
jgi:hypothetical protein